MVLVAKQYGVALRALLILTVILGIAYPLAMTGVGQVAFSNQANGSLVKVDGKTVGSSLIGQNFTDAKGNPLPQYFQPRPSAAGDGYDANASSGSNLGPNNPDLIKAIKERRAQVAAFNQVPPSAVPADALTASGSGLDPDISVAYADLQVRRVAQARGLSPAAVQHLVDTMTKGRALGVLGEPRVNVLELNVAVNALKG
ncbi:potassium-transporting ATPase subunit KdpC [Branchiibius sp. NY16-3462-2]|uniref:potassium-transporting ATPase subunit KdpC n=1 Tax=Branchiibius sp. NY16-3462-2 TaxID=1807500 RepID=UPI000794FCA7|nr:potassium-transporting ATPase subunit KdpC [Branchiibius sp. NY16-3462-2]KYH45844.1 potassium transporter KtrA [Branchiibius sp. NY16-3462-2]